jgi:hypothetical protein
MPDQTPTLGRIVQYVLNEGDVAAINQMHPDKSKYNQVRAEQTLPAIVVATFGGTTVNLRVLLDGYGEYWATSRQEGDGPFYWHWPARV